MATFQYFINLDERGEFNADVRNEQGKTVYEIDTAEAHWLFENYNINVNRKEQIQQYLIEMKLMKENDILVKGN